MNNNDGDFLNKLHSRLTRVEIEIDELVMEAEKEGEAIRIRLIVGKLRNLETLLQQQRAYLISTLGEEPSLYHDGRALNERQKMVLAIVKTLQGQQPLTAYMVSKAVDLPTSSVYRILRKLVNSGFVAVHDGGYTAPESKS